MVFDPISAITAGGALLGVLVPYLAPFVAVVANKHRLAILRLCTLL